MKKLLLTASLFLMTMWCCGCATVLTKDTQNITVNSQPPGAKVQIGPYKGITPCVLQIPKGKNYAIDVNYGEQKQSVPLTKQVAGTTLINILFWPGFIVDAITGNVQKYEPTEYNFTFEPMQ